MKSWKLRHERWAPGWGQENPGSCWGVWPLDLGLMRRDLADCDGGRCWDLVGLGRKREEVVDDGTAAPQPLFALEEG